MAIGVDIIKSREDLLNKIYYYAVSTSDFGGHKFYIAIDQKKQLIDFYQTNDFDSPIGTIDLNKENPFEDKIDSISQSLSNLVAFRGLKAIQSNNFPEQLGFSS